MKIKLPLSILFSFVFCLLSSQIGIRLFTQFTPDNAYFTVSSGEYLVSDYSGHTIKVSNGEMLIIARYNGGVAVKKRNGIGLTADSVELKGLSGRDLFSLRINEPVALKRNYSGDLRCFADMETLVLINSCDIEEYVAGVVRAEGGKGKGEEYFRTQAVIARTYTYKYYFKHTPDRYNLCDDTHCQAYNGRIEDSVIINAVNHTKDQVISTPDSMLIISAFHSNCGGETSPSEYAWVTGKPYLRKVEDPYCRKSRNALWERKISVKTWTDLLIRNGYPGFPGDPSVFSFSQPERVANYITGSFSIPLRSVRTALDLRSSYFSVTASGDSLFLSGSGYGHGVGLCQEGAMEMAIKGFTYREIINFYYSGVKIINIADARKNMEDEVSLAIH